MARVVIENFPDDLYRELKVKAAREGTTVKAIMIAAARKAVGLPDALRGGKAGAK